MNDNRNAASALAHLGWILPVPFLGTGIIYYLNEDAQVRDHARQAIFYQLMCLIASMLLFSGTYLAAMILPTALLGLVSLLMYVVCLGLLVPPVMGAIAAYSGKQYRYPFIGALAYLLPF